MPRDNAEFIGGELANLRARFDTVRRRVGGRGSKAKLLDEACEYFDAALEELSTAAEELRVQESQLDATLQELQWTSRRFDDVLQQSPVACIVTDTGGRILEANQAAARLFNKNRQELLSIPLDLFYSFGRRGEFHAWLDQVKRSSEAQRWTTTIKPCNRTSRQVDVLAVAMHGPVGEVSTLRWVFWDLPQGRQSDWVDQFLARAQQLLGRKPPRHSLSMILVELSRRLGTCVIRILFRRPPEPRPIHFPAPASSLAGSGIERLLEQSFPPPGGDARLGVHYATTALRGWSPLYVDNTAEALYAGDRERAAIGWSSSMVLPLLDREDLQAVLVLGSPRAEGFSPTQRHLLEQLAPLLAGPAGAIAAAEADVPAGGPAAIEESLRGLEELRRFFETIPYTPDHQILIEQMLTHVRQAGQTDFSAALLVRESCTEAFVQSSAPVSREASQAILRRLCESFEALAQKPLPEGEPVLHMDSPPGQPGEREKRSALDSAFVAPITVEGRVAGIVLLGHLDDRPMGRQQLRLLDTASWLASHLLARLGELRSIERHLEFLTQRLDEGVCLLDTRASVRAGNPIGIACAREMGLLGKGASSQAVACAEDGYIGTVSLGAGQTERFRVERYRLGFDLLRGGSILICRRIAE